MGESRRMRAGNLSGQSVETGNRQTEDAFLVHQARSKGSPLTIKVHRNAGARSPHGDEFDFSPDKHRQTR